MSPERKNGISAENQEKKEGEKTFEFKDLASLEEYLAWKKEVPIEFRRLVESAMIGQEPRPSQTGLPLTDQFLNSVGEHLKGLETARVNRIVKNLLNPLSRIRTQDGYVDAFKTLVNPDISWNLKRQIYDTQIKQALEWLAGKDLEELTKKTQEREEAGKEPLPGEAEEDVPSASEKVSSSMERGVEKREGEPRALFSVKPFYGDYYEREEFDKFDDSTFEWTRKQKNEFTTAGAVTMDPLGSRILYGKITGNQPLDLPHPEDWAFEPENLETNAPEGSAEVLRNQNGNWYFNIKEAGVFNYQIKLGPRQTIEEREKFTPAEIIGQLPEELLQKIRELKGERLPPMKLKRELLKFIRAHLTYSNSPEAWACYAKNPREYFKRIWERKEADCFVANTLGARALAEIDENFRFVSGHYVKEKNEQGEAIMHAGNAHGWLKVWDEASARPVRLDAAPKGDPSLDEAQQERDLAGEGENGDYGDEELASEEEVKEKIREFKNKEGRGAGQKRRPEFKMEEQNFAELAECTPAQAREFLRALERVRQIEDEKGISISDLLKDEWRKIVEERKVQARGYRGPVRMDEGDRLEDPVAALIDIKSREFNPTGFERDEQVEKIEVDFGGANIFFSFDLSDSMTEADGASGRRKADVQRDVALLFVDSLMQAAVISRREGEWPEILPIKIMVTLASSKGEVKLHLTDKWTPKEQWALYSALTQLAKGGTPTHETLKLIEKDFDQERDSWKKKNIPKEKQPINYTAEISDGEPDDFDETEAMHRQLEEKGMAIRSYCIGGESASQDAAPPIESFSQLPQILAKDIIEVFKKLNPRKIKS